MPRSRTELAAAEAAAEESARRSEQDAAHARQVRERGQHLAEVVRSFNAANGFTRWLLKDASGGGEAT